MNIFDKCFSVQGHTATIYICLVFYLVDLNVLQRKKRFEKSVFKKNVLLYAPDCKVIDNNIFMFCMNNTFKCSGGDIFL